MDNNNDKINLKEYVLKDAAGQVINMSVAEFEQKVKDYKKEILKNNEDLKNAKTDNINLNSYISFNENNENSYIYYATFNGRIFKQSINIPTELFILDLSKKIWVSAYDLYSKFMENKPKLKVLTNYNDIYETEQKNIESFKL